MSDEWLPEIDPEDGMTVAYRRSRRGRQWRLPGALVTALSWVAIAIILGFGVGAILLHAFEGMHSNLPQ